MNKQSIILTTTTLLLSGAIASAQTPARDLPDAANPNAAQTASGKPAGRQRTGPYNHWSGSGLIGKNAAGNG